MSLDLSGKMVSLLSLAILSNFLKNNNFIIFRQTFPNESIMNTFRTLKRRYGRTSLITVGIALAIAFSTIMLSVSEAIHNSSQQIIEETGVDLMIEPNTDLPPLVSQYTTFFEIHQGRIKAEAMINNNTKIRASSPWLMKNLYIAKEPEEINISKPPKFTLTDCRGYIPENNRYFSAYKIIEGTELPTMDDPFYANGTYQDGFKSKNFTHEILISKQLSKLLDVSIGDIVYLSPILISDEFTNQSIADWFDNATWFKIYGIKQGRFESRNALAAHVHLSELQYITGKYKKDTVHKIYLSLYHKSDRNDVKKWLETKYQYKDEISVHTPEELLENIMDFTKIFEGFSRMVVIITVLVAVLFISTILMISTRERGSEIGALRAIGISRFTINKFILKESFLICIMALVIGLIIGFFVSNFINDYFLNTQDYLPEGFKVTMITPYLILQVTIITTIIALLASLGPIYWIMHLKPVETLRNE